MHYWDILKWVQMEKPQTADTVNMRTLYWMSKNLLTMCRNVAWSHTKKVISSPNFFLQYETCNLLFLQGLRKKAKIDTETVCYMIASFHRAEGFQICHRKMSNKTHRSHIRSRLLQLSQCFLVSCSPALTVIHSWHRLFVYLFWLDTVHKFPAIDFNLKSTQPLYGCTATSSGHTHYLEIVITVMII